MPVLICNFKKDQKAGRALPSKFPSSSSAVLGPMHSISTSGDRLGSTRRTLPRGRKIGYESCEKLEKNYSFETVL